jgi:hypothetical protein
MTGSAGLAPTNFQIGIFSGVVAGLLAAAVCVYGPRFAQSGKQRFTALVQQLLSGWRAP